MSRDPELILCRCEEITEREVREAIEAGCRTVDEIKRATRAGMGPCQGRTCARLIERILRGYFTEISQEATGMNVQFPVRPVLLCSIANAIDLSKEPDSERSEG